MFEVTDTSEQEYSVLLHQTYYFVGDRIVASGDAGNAAVAPEALSFNHAVEEALWLLPSSIFSELYALLENSQFYLLHDKEVGDYPEVTKCQFERERLPVAFQQVPLRLVKAWQ